MGQLGKAAFVSWNEDSRFALGLKGRGTKRLR